MSVHATLERVRASLEGTTVITDSFFNCLAEFFGYDSHEKITEEDLKFLKWEDLEDCGLPKGKARQVASILRSDEPEEDPAPVSAFQPGQPIIVTSDDPEVKAKSMTPRQLIENADLTKKTDVYAQRLNELAEGRRFVVYTNEGSKNVEKTVELFDQLEDYPERHTVLVDGDPRRVYFVFDKPARVLNEHPLHKDRALRPDDAWNNVDFKTRQLIRVAIHTTSELGVEDYHEVDLIRDATESGYEYIATKYPQAAIKLGELESVGKAPTLKIKIDKSRAKAGTVTDGDGNEVAGNNPFLGANRTT